MFNSALSQAREAVGTLKACLVTHERTRYVVRRAAEADGEYPDELRPLVEAAPNHVDWRAYDHCAAFTRLYAIYEKFVADLVSAWLQELPQLYPAYVHLPSEVRSNHRAGLGMLLQKLDDGRRDVTEGYLIEEYNKCVTGEQPYSLVARAFLTDEQNYWPEVLVRLFRRTGLSNPINWLEKNPGVQDLLKETWGEDSTTAESEIRRLVQLRNEAAHDDPSDLVATDEIQNIASFLLAAFTALAELATDSVVRAFVAEGRAQELGKVTRRFSSGVNGFSAKPCQLSVGDQIVVCGDASCFVGTVQSIEVDHERLESLQTEEGQGVGVQLDKPARKGATLIVVPDPSALELTG